MRKVGQLLAISASKVLLILIFKLPFSITSEPSTNETPSHCTVPMVLDNPSGTFNSPLFPRRYPNNLFCIWRRNSGNGGRIRLSFTFWDLEEGFDFIEVFENGLPLGRLEGKSESEMSQSFIVTGTLEIRLTTDGTVVQRGFTATYEEASCGLSVLFSHYNGDDFIPKPVTSPGWPARYANNLKCYFIIEVPYGSQIELDIASVRTERCCDSLEVKDGNMNAVTLNNATNLLYVSITNRIQLYFSSDSSITDQGFQATFRQDTLCPPGKWTQFFNRDSPSGGGDSEVLESLHREFPGQICNRPSRIDARLNNFFDYRNANKLVRIGPSEGLSCDHALQGHRGRCPNFQVRFCCPPEPRCGGRNAWTRFYNHDNPSGNGDHEGLVILRAVNVGEICENPSSIDVQTSDGKDYRRTGMNVRYSHLWGFECLNNDQVSGACPDFQIRFCCPSKN